MFQMMSLPHAGFIVAAYAVAGVVLAGLITISLIQLRRRQEKLQHMRARSDETAENTP